MIGNLVNTNGNEVRNQFVIKANNGKGFQSYETICAAKIGDRIYLNSTYFGENFQYGSKTTRKHLYKWMRDNTFLQPYSVKCVRQFIREGRIIMKAEQAFNVTITITID